MQIHVRIIEAKDIARMDGLGKSDPYCLVQLSSSQSIQRTKVIDNCLTPKWNEEFHFPVVNQATDVLHILMKDKDIASDDPMAKLELCLGTLQPNNVVDQWYDMTPVKGVKKGGQIHLLLHLAPTGAAPFIQGQAMPPQQQQQQYPPSMGYPPQQQPPMGYPPQQQMMGGYPPQQQMMGQPGMMMPPGQQPMMGYPPQQQPMMGYPPQQGMMMGQPGMMMPPGQQPMMGMPMQQQIPGIPPGWTVPPGFQVLPPPQSSGGRMIYPNGMSAKDYEKAVKKQTKALAQHNNCDYKAWKKANKQKKKK